MSMHRITPTAPLALILALGLAGCSGADEDSTSASASDATTSDVADSASADTEAGDSAEASGTTDALEQAVRDYSESFFAGDADGAYALLSTRCAAQTDETSFAANIASVQILYPSPGPDLLTVDVSVDGSTGSATYTYSDSSVDVSDQPWTYEGGGWRYDQC